MKESVKVGLLLAAGIAFAIWNWGPGSKQRKRDAQFQGILQSAVVDGYIVDMRCGRSGPVQVVAGRNFRLRGYAMEPELLQVIWYGCASKRPGVELIEVRSESGALIAMFTLADGLAPVGR